MTTSITQLLLTPVRMGDLDLRNRIVMAPLTRMRADNADRPAIIARQVELTRHP